MKALEFIIMFLILLTTCSTFYLHWYYNNDHENYKINRPVPMRPFLRTKEASIVVAVPTHNRIGYVQLTSAALKGTFPDDDLWVFDDTSSEYSTFDLIGWYGTEHIWQSKKRLKADAMARHILEWFVTTKYDVLVLMDSDLLVSPNWLSDLRVGLRESTGLLSLYRSGAPKHKSLSCGDVLCMMPSMGNAGTVWRRDLVKRMLLEMPARDGGFDWGWSEWCSKNDIPMEALKESAVLHIGVHGSWSHESTAEKSVGFPMKELSVDVRKQAKHFLKGGKPQKIVKFKQIEHDIKPIEKHVVVKRPNDILWVIPAFKRAWSLDLVLKSLTGREATNILVSKDADSADIDSVLSKYSVDVIEHPWSCSRHPNQFPAKDELLNKNYKGDTYGNPRSPWATCLKHHWWWMMKQAWARKPRRVCVLEDDTVIHPQVFEWLAKQTGNVKLTPEEIAVPWCMSAKEWQTIEPKAFCEHDDYNWDQTIAWMKEHEHGPNEAVVPSVALSMHVGDCGGWDAGGRDKKCTSKQIKDIRGNVAQWIAKPLAVDTSTKKWLTAHTKPNGGWGHPRDWAHCLGNDAQRSGMHFLERLEHYLPKHDYLFPTDVKSIEKQILTFDIPNHVSITFGAPVGNIAISTKNWHNEHKTQCPNCEFVNDPSATVKWVVGCPSNPQKDYKDQILVCSCGESQKGTGARYFNSGIHKCDYDASFLNRDFQDAYTHLHLTPPQYKQVLSVTDEMKRYLEMPPKQEDKAVFIHSDCGHERGTFVSKMIRDDIIPIDRYGQCWRNKDIKTIEPSRENWYWGDSQGNRDTTKTDAFTNYKFSFALENTKSRDYYTEKRYQSFLALTVPIVWKNDNSEQYTPGEKSVIYPEDHGDDPRQLAEYLLRLTTDDKAYQKHMGWKKKGIRREFVKTLFKKTDFMACRICEKVSTKSSSTKYTVVIPSVKRNNDEYLKKTLESLEIAKPSDVPVILVNGNQPHQAHTYLRKWCASHDLYKCIEPPPVSESSIQRAIKEDKRGDTEHFLRWRTTETEHALFGLREALKLHTEYIIWMQDDVIVNKYLFASLYTEDVVCLRDGKDYCGAVAYLFSRKFVSELIPKIEATKLTMPIDWIIFDPRPSEAKYNVPKRIPLVTHIGKKSSKHIEQRIGVVLPYHERHNLLKIMSLQSHPEDLVLVQDLGLEFKGFQNVVHTIRHASHKPIGKSVMEGYDWLYNNGYSIICNLDSDVLVKKDWLTESTRLLQQYPNDIVSAFNEANHLKHCVVQEFNDHYLKNCGGGIQYCFTRELYKTFVRPILSTIEAKGDLNYWDAGIVERVQAQGKYIIATKPSRIQHIGYTGFKENYEGLNSRNKLWQIAPDYVLSDKEITLIGNIPELSILMRKPIDQLKNTDLPTIKTSDLFAAIDYNAPENKGPWKQGWDYEYDNRFKDGLTVHVVPHSHNDPGWIKTYHTYYSTQTKHILDTVITALTEDSRRTFIWAEISYFSLWWEDASQQQKEQSKKLVAEKRLDFVTGGWVMNDEASVTARATRWQLEEGRQWLQKTFGITPQYSWAIDPFGHSAGQAQVLKELGYKGMLIQRVHYAVKKQLAEKQQLEFQWQTPAGEIFTHMMPFYSYDGPHTCGPDPSICCQFDFARINGGYSGCPWHKPSVPITDSNVAERSKLWIDQVYKKAMLYRGKHVFVPVGDDFRYQTMDEAHKQFTNYQKMFDWIGKNVPTVKASFSTLSRYFDAVRETNVPKLQGSFFPYSDREKDYWTGYFNSRIFYKGYDRLLESLIAAVETRCPAADIHLQKRALGLFQHHDGITGTAKSHVVQDYYKTMQKAVTELKSKLKTCLNTNTASIIYYNNGCNKNWLKTMGYTGECVQHDSIMETFERLHYDYKVTEKTPNCLAGQRNAILLVSSGHSVASQFVDCFKKVYLLDWFGTSKDMTPRGVILLNAMRKGIGQFLGYTLPPKYTGVKPRRQAYGILLGKLPRYWVQKKHLLSKMSDVKFACVTCDIEMKNVVNHKRLPRDEYIKLTSEATFLLGAGHPVGSPSVLEALQNGLTIILPKIQHYKMGVTHATQHDDIHAIMNEQPEVRKRICYYENDEKMVECVRSAQKYPPLTLISYTSESFDMRMKTFFGQTNANGHVLVNPLSIDTPTMKADEIRPYEEDACVPVPTAGLQFAGIKLDEHGHVIQINGTPVHESLVWRSNKPGQGVAGAYLMAVTSTKDILRPTKHTTCVAKQYKQAETKFDMLSRRIRVYNDGTIEFIYDADIRARNNGELWAVYKPEWLAERLCSDVHGLTWECHTERKDAPLQAKFWPMPTMAWLASSSERLTFTGSQPTGVGFHEGAMVLMLDRRGDKDDARGLGQGITDSRPVEMRFGVVMETEGLKERASEKALSVRNWMLNPEIKLV